MPVVMQMYWPGVTRENYEAACEQVGWEQVPAEGGIVHVAASDEGGLRIVDVWESREAFERFARQRLIPVTTQPGLPGEPEVAFYEVHATFNVGLPQATSPAAA